MNRPVLMLDPEPAGCIKCNPGPVKAWLVRQVGFVDWDRIVEIDKPTHHAPDTVTCPVCDTTHLYLDAVDKGTAQ